MKLYFYSRYYPTDVQEIATEGTRKAVHGLASGLAACGVDVTILSEGRSDGLFKMPEGYKVQHFYIELRGQNFEVPKGLRAYIKDHMDRDSLVILSGIFQPKMYSVSALLRKQHVPYIIMPHDPYNPEIFSKNRYLKWLYWYFIERPMLKRSVAIQVLDDRHTTFLRSLGIKNSIITVPNGFSDIDLHSEANLTWNWENPAKLFFLGRMDAHNKGLDLLIDAFAQVAELTDAKLTLQGVDGGDRKSLEDQATQRSLSNRVLFLEPDYATSASLLIQEYDIFCLTSRFEGFGLSALEAMLAGRVLLVSEVAGIAPHVQASGCGVVVSPEVSAIKAGLMTLLQKRSEWKEMGLKGRHYVLEHLRWDEIASAALKHYQQFVHTAAAKDT